MKLLKDEETVVEDGVGMTVVVGREVDGAGVEDGVARIVVSTEAEAVVKVEITVVVTVRLMEGVSIIIEVVNSEENVSVVGNSVVKTMKDDSEGLGVGTDKLVVIVEIVSLQENFWLSRIMQISST